MFRLVSPQKKVKLTGLGASVTKRSRLNQSPTCYCCPFFYSLAVFEPPMLPASRDTSSDLLASHCVPNQAPHSPYARCSHLGPVSSIAGRGPIQWWLHNESFANAQGAAAQIETAIDYHDLCTLCRRAAPAENVHPPAGRHPTTLPHFHCIFLGSRLLSGGRHKLMRCQGPFGIP